jgi:hypothetical protein
MNEREEKPMTTAADAPAQAELDAAEKALAAFDASSLVHEDGSRNEEAEAQLRRLHERVDAARARAQAG